jgi:HEPN domain-containing protein
MATRCVDPGTHAASRQRLPDDEPRPTWFQTSVSARAAAPYHRATTTNSSLGDAALDREGFRRLAEKRINEAQALLDAGHASGAYYLAGYSVECALKASICQLFGAQELPDKTTVDRSYSHDLSQLVKVAGLQGKLDQQEAADPNFQINWTIVKDWTVASRYDFWSDKHAKELLEAVADPDHGVLTWLRLHW